MTFLESNQPNPSPEANAEGDIGIGDDTEV